MDVHAERALDAVEPLLATAEQHPRRGVAPDALGSLEGKIALTRASLAYMRGDVATTEAMARAGAARRRPRRVALATMLLGARAVLRRRRGRARSRCSSRCASALPGAAAPQMRLTTLGLLAAARRAGDAAAPRQRPSS